MPLKISKPGSPVGSDRAVPRRTRAGTNDLGGAESKIQPTRRAKKRVGQNSRTPKRPSSGMGTMGRESNNF